MTQYKTYAWTDYKFQSYVTPYKRYEVLSTQADGRAFTADLDTASESYCLYNSCAHIGKNDWNTEVWDFSEVTGVNSYPEYAPDLSGSFLWSSTPQGQEFWSECEDGDIPESVWRPIVDEMRNQGIFKEEETKVTDRVGEKVIYTGGVYFKKGEVLTCVLDDGSSSLIWSNGEEELYIPNCDLEPYTDIKFKKGSKAVVVSNTCSSGMEWFEFEIGEVLTCVLDDGSSVLRWSNGEDEKFFPDDCLEPYVETKEEEEPVFKIGDKVRITGNSNCSCNSVGDVGTIVKGPDWEGDFRVEVQGKDLKGNWTRTSEMELIDSTTILKVGDKVKLTGNSGGSVNSVGDVGVITQVDRTFARVKVGDRSDMACWSRMDELELYTEEGTYVLIDCGTPTLIGTKEEIEGRIKDRLEVFSSEDYTVHKLGDKVEFSVVKTELEVKLEV